MNGLGSLERLNILKNRLETKYQFSLLQIQKFDDVLKTTYNQNQQFRDYILTEQEVESKYPIYEEMMKKNPNYINLTKNGFAVYLEYYYREYMTLLLAQYYMKLKEQYQRCQIKHRIFENSYQELKEKIENLQVILKSNLVKDTGAVHIDMLETAINDIVVEEENPKSIELPDPYSYYIEKEKQMKRRKR